MPWKWWEKNWTSELGCPRLSGVRNVSCQPIVAIAELPSVCPWPVRIGFLFWTGFFCRIVFSFFFLLRCVAVSRCLTPCRWQVDSSLVKWKKNHEKGAKTGRTREREREKKRQRERERERESDTLCDVLFQSRPSVTHTYGTQPHTLGARKSDWIRSPDVFFSLVILSNRSGDGDPADDFQKPSDFKSSSCSYLYSIFRVAYM